MDPVALPPDEGEQLGNHRVLAELPEYETIVLSYDTDFEVAPEHGLLRPPAVEHAPLLTHERDRLVVDPLRRAVEARLDPCGPRLVQSSRGTNSARVSGIRDHGATSTTVQTEPEPVLARTCRSPSRRRVRSSAPAASSSSCRPAGSVSSTSSSRSSSTGPGSSASFGASAMRILPASALGSRSVSARRHEPPPTSLAASATLRT